MNRAEMVAALQQVRTIALVGASPKTHRPSYEVMAFLQHKGYRVIPVNPSFNGNKILNETVYASLQDIPEPFDMVEIFRNSEAAGETCDEILKLNSLKRPWIVWMQVGVINEAAARKLQSENIQVVMDACPKQILI